jgi:tRNA U38,U39,U40 pseudouridine synthase TruA
MKTYGIAITAGGVKYHFHVDNINKVRELFAGSYDITEFIVTEETHDYTATTFRTMTDAEVQDIIWGRTAQVQILGVVA